MIQSSTLENRISFLVWELPNDHIYVHTYFPILTTFHLLTNTCTYNILYYRVRHFFSRSWLVQFCILVLLISESSYFKGTIMKPFISYVYFISTLYIVDSLRPNYSDVCFRISCQDIVGISHLCSKLFDDIRPLLLSISNILFVMHDVCKVSYIRPLRVLYIKSHLMYTFVS